MPIEKRYNKKFEDLKMKSVKSISVAAPAYNEAEGIESVLVGWIEFLRAVPELDEFEIVICNDGSKDQTGNILDTLAAAHKELKPVHHPVNHGAAAALTTAIHHTAQPWVLLIDSDGQYPIRTFKQLVAAVEQSDSQAAIGVRVKKHDRAFARFGSWASGSLCNVFHGTRYRDFNCALKLVDGGILRSISLEAKGLNYSTELSSRLIERGIKMTEVEVEHKPRSFGRSSARLSAAWHRLLFVLYIGVRQFLIEQKVLQTFQNKSGPPRN